MSPRSTVRFVAFAAEEVGLRGGWDYATKAKAAQRDIRAMLNFDMIGHRLADQPDRDYYVVWYAGGESLARIDSSVARTYTTLTPVMTTSYRTGSDSYCFAEQGYRAVFHIERDFSPFYHSPNDRADTLDFGYAAEIARVGLGTLIRVDQEVPSGGTVAPGSYALAQNYPNPFNAGTEIRYSVGSTGRVVLTIHDLLGKEVARLVDADLTPGSYAVRWAADNVASGVFIGRLSGGGGSIRMVHIQ